jgi:hypothetical protein
MPLSSQTDLGSPFPGLMPPSIDWEIRAERASSMGRAGRRVEEALKGLATFSGAPEAREILLREAADAVWSYFVQREMMGFRRHDDAVEAYAIPAEVLRRVGC